MAIRPFELLRRSLGREVQVEMKDGRCFTGVVESYDDSLNLWLTKARELSTGREFKEVVLKGGNIASLSLV